MATRAKKTKKGRPFLPPEERLTSRVELKLTADEKETYVQASKDEGFPNLNAWIRWVVRNHMKELDNA